MTSVPPCEPEALKYIGRSATKVVPSVVCAVMETSQQAAGAPGAQKYCMTARTISTVARECATTPTAKEAERPWPLTSVTQTVSPEEVGFWMVSHSS